MTEKILTLDFDDISDMFVTLDAHSSPSEVHGQLAGLLAAGKRLTDKQWLEEAQNLLDTDKGFTEQDEQALHCIYANTLAALADEDFGFYPLLPDDSEALEQKLASLSLWCQGFMAGFALVEKSIAALSDTVNDALHDLAAISQVGMDDEDEQSASADDDYMQLVEYVRLAAMNIFVEYAAELPEPPATEKAQEGLSVQNLFRNRQIH